jgi:hypothetical protein
MKPTLPTVSTNALMPLSGAVPQTPVNPLLKQAGPPPCPGCGRPLTLGHYLQYIEHVEITAKSL